MKAKGKSDLNEEEKEEDEEEEEEEDVTIYAVRRPRN